MCIYIIIYIKYILLFLLYSSWLLLLLTHIYTIGPNDQELPEPLHFNVSADTEHLLKAMVKRMQQHVEQVRVELQAASTSIIMNN